MLLRPNQNHIVGFNGVGVPENVDDLHACVISDGTEEKKCVFKYGSAAAETYVNSISHGKSPDNSETNPSLVEVVNATNSSTSATKDASVTGKAPLAPSEASSEAVDVNLSITSGWNTGFNGMLQFDSPITSNG